MVLQDLKEVGRVNEFRLMKEALIPGFTTYFFEKNSPFVTVINQMVMRKYQHGFNEEKVRRRFGKAEENNTRSYFVSLSLSHLQGAFLLMVLGSGLGIVSFILEAYGRSTIRLERFLISKCIPDILCISEHFVNAAMCREIALEGYHTTTTHGRPNLQQGGVGVLSRDDDFTALDRVNCLSVELHCEVSAVRLDSQKFSPTAPKRNITSAFFDILGICLGRPIKDYYAYNKLQKFIFTLWQLDSIILIAAFQCALITSLLVPKYGDQIDSIEDLHKSNLTIFTPPELGFMVDFFTCTKLKKQLRNVSARYYDYLFKEKLRHQALVVPYSLASMVLQDLKEVGRVNEFRLMKEALIPGFTTYFFEKNSPFVTVINQMVMRKYQHGFNEEKVRRRFGKAEENNTRSYFVSLSLSHLQGAFLLKVLGSGLGIVSFILEVWKW
ncbi:hypothetical protein HHI36_002664 [Cryptolaemus montrouzieri]|uniref:Uncharacterized protein n=1 Tax=Cryptolaemus montrouzieri TaxID=559131 RepID=A0ABD2PB44_9CUCU